MACASIHTNSLLDPYGKGIDGSMELTPAAFSYECDVVDRKVIGSAYGAMSTVDSLGHMPVSVAIDDRDTHKHEGDPAAPACAVAQNRHL